MSTDLVQMTQKPSGMLEVVHHLRDIYELGQMLVASRMIPSGVNTPEAAAAIILKGHELGIGPMQAFDSISVIQGKPTISPQLMLALIERSGLLEDLQVAEEKDSCSITLKRRGRTPQTVTFDRSEAVAMGLAGKDNWKKQFGVMMYWRCVAKACRRVFPDVIAGCYTPDEMGAEVDEDGATIIDGEVIEPEAPRKLTEGLHTRDHKLKTVEFLGWLKAKVDKVNQKWQDEWADLLVARQSDGHAVPDKMPDLVSTIQIKGHLLKWAIAAEWLDASIVPEDVKPINCEAYVAKVFADPDGKQAILAELGDYLQKQKRDKTAAFYRKNPHLASEEFVAEQAEVAEKAVDRGDAYEEPETAIIQGVAS